MVVSAPGIETRSQLERRLTEQTDRCPGDHTRLALGPHVSDGSAGGRERREDVCGEFQTLAPMSARELEAGASGAIVPFCVIAIDDPILRYDVAVGRGTMSCVSVLPELLEIRAVTCPWLTQARQLPSGRGGFVALFRHAESYVEACGKTHSFLPALSLSSARQSQDADRIGFNLINTYR